MVRKQDLINEIKQMTLQEAVQYIRLEYKDVLDKNLPRLKDLELGEDRDTRLIQDTVTDIIDIIYHVKNTYGEY